MTEMTAGGTSFIRAGEGRPLIFIHGWAMASSVWQRQVAYFQGKGFETVAIDLRGHGDSSKEGPFTLSQMSYDLKGFIHEMGYKSPVLVGWSRGAMVILDFVVKHSHSASLVCLVGGTPKFTREEGFDHGLPSKDVKGMKLKLKRDFERSIRDFRQTIADDIDEEKKEILMNCPLPAREAAKAGLKELMEVDLRDSIERVKIPALLVHGKNDPVCMPGASEYMANRIEKAALHFIESAGHVPFLSHEEKFNSLLEDFIRRN
ncbi:MAG: alpha/beta fold hydrolase [Deltaproteobacteria bacterium]|nr:alpha/beta fold hydrolase [Deltaproteobacteria bacterium]